MQAAIICIRSQTARYSPSGSVHYRGSHIAFIMCFRKVAAKSFRWNKSKHYICLCVKRDAASGYNKNRYGLIWQAMALID